MLPFLADENFHGPLITALMKRNPAVDLLRVQDVGLEGKDDPTILDWAALENRILLTHDRKTIPRFALDRVQKGLPMPGVWVIRRRSIPIQRIVDEILLFAECNLDGEWANQILFFPI